MRFLFIRRNSLFKEALSKLIFLVPNLDLVKAKGCPMDLSNGIASSFWIAIPT